jgi:hypothetical protein
MRVKRRGGRVIRFFRLSESITSGAGSLVVGFGPHFCLVGLRVYREKGAGQPGQPEVELKRIYPLYYHKHLSMLAKRFMIIG